MALILHSSAIFSGLLFVLVEAFYAAKPLILLGLLKTATGVYFLGQMLLVLGKEAVLSLAYLKFPELTFTARINNRSIFSLD